MDIIQQIAQERPDWLEEMRWWQPLEGPLVLSVTIRAKDVKDGTVEHLVRLILACCKVRRAAGRVVVVHDTDDFRDWMLP